MVLLFLETKYITFQYIISSGNGDGFYSSGFQSQLIGNSLHNASLPRHVAYGAIVTLKNHKTGGGYLHSHHHLYPENVGARQQQVDCRILQFPNTNEISCFPCSELMFFLPNTLTAVIFFRNWW